MYCTGLPFVNIRQGCRIFGPFIAVFFHIYWTCTSFFSTTRSGRVKEQGRHALAGAAAFAEWGFMTKSCESGHISRFKQYMSKNFGVQLRGRIRMGICPQPGYMGMGQYQNPFNFQTGSGDERLRHRAFFSGDDLLLTDHKRCRLYEEQPVGLFLSRLVPLISMWLLQLDPAVGQATRWITTFQTPTSTPQV